MRSPLRRRKVRKRRRIQKNHLKGKKRKAWRLRSDLPFIPFATQGEGWSLSHLLLGFIWWHFCGVVEIVRRKTDCIKMSFLCFDNWLRSQMSPIYDPCHP
jgi:hypothetical protein